jgi:hypothetical protein
MIHLAQDCLLFDLPSGESVPLSAEMISFELAGTGDKAKQQLDFLEHAAASVLHYFKHDLKRKSVSVAEFANVFENVLRGLGLEVESNHAELILPGGNSEDDLGRLAMDAGPGGELAFFPRLRETLRRRITQSPAVIRYTGLRACAKNLSGARRWSPRCEELRRQVVAFLRECLSIEASGRDCSLVVD